MKIKLITILFALFLITGCSYDTSEKNFKEYEVKFAKECKITGNSVMAEISIKGVTVDNSKETVKFVFNVVSISGEALVEKDFELNVEGRFNIVQNVNLDLSQPSSATDTCRITT